LNKCQVETGKARWVRDQRQAGAWGTVAAVMLRGTRKEFLQGQVLNMDPESLSPVIEKLLDESKIEKIDSETGEYYRTI